MKKIIIVLVGLMLFASLPLTSAVTLETGTIIDPTDSNTTYILGNTMSFSSVIIRNNSIYFNDTIFSMEADSGNVAVTINTLTSFSVTASDNVAFTLGGFTPGTSLGVYVDGAYWQAVTADISGTVSFTYFLFSTHLFSFGSIPLSPSGPGSAKPSEVLEVPEIPTPGRADTPFLLWIILCIFISIIMLILFALKRKKS